MGLEDETPGPDVFSETCPDCQTKHIRRRLVICHDDDERGSDAPKTKATNIYRIWSMIKEGEVADPHDGKPWEQIRGPYLDQVGTDSGAIVRFFSGEEGPKKYEAKVRDVYKMCSKMCASRDEIWLFGFGRGAFVMKSVAGLLAHLKAPKGDIPEFDDEILKCLQIYLTAPSESHLASSQTFIHLSEQTKPAAKVGFLGCFDTIKALDEAKLRDIGALSSIVQVRHAMGFFERRDSFKVERYGVAGANRSFGNRTFQEAWFAGSHGNLGGGLDEDGLALWPLQWIVGEAKKCGLVLDFKPDNRFQISDPAQVIFPGGDAAVKHVVAKNRISVDMWDLRPTLDKPEYTPQLDMGRLKLTTVKLDRAVFIDGRLIGRRNDDANGVFIHPSVFLMDQNDTRMLLSIDSLNFSQELRGQEAFSVPNRDQIFWDIHQSLVHPSQTSTSEENEWIGSKLDSSIQKLIPLVMDTRPEVHHFDKQDRLDQLINSAIKAVAEEFHHDDFTPAEHVRRTRELLFPPPPSATWTETAQTWIAQSAAGALTSSLFGPLGTVLWSGGTAINSVMNFVNKAQQIEVLMVSACIDILLTMERLYRYAGGRKTPDESALKAACVDHLHLKPRVTEKLSTQLSGEFLKEEDALGPVGLKKLLAEMVDEFKYKPDGLRLGGGS